MAYAARNGQSEDEYVKVGAAMNLNRDLAYAKLDRHLLVEKATDE